MHPLAFHPCNHKKNMVTSQMFSFFEDLPHKKQERIIFIRKANMNIFLWMVCSKRINETTFKRNCNKRSYFHYYTFFQFWEQGHNWNMNSFSCLKTCKLLNKVYMRLLTYNQPFKGCLNDGHLNYWKTLQNEKDSKWFFHGSKIAWKRPLLVILNVTTFNYLIKLPPKKVQPWCKRLFPLSKHTTSLHVQ
jgi:hypothetical protein